MFALNLNFQLLITTVFRAKTLTSFATLGLLRIWLLNFFSNMGSLDDLIFIERFHSRDQTSSKFVFEKRGSGFLHDDSMSWKAPLVSQIK